MAVRTEDASEETVFMAAEGGPVLVERGGRPDMVVLSADLHASLIDAAQTGTAMTGDDIAQDPLMHQLAVMNSSGDG